MAAATDLRCGENGNSEKNWNSVKIWPNYHQFSQSSFLDMVYIMQIHLLTSLSEN